MPEQGMWGFGQGFSGEKWDQEAFFGEIKRLSGIPVKESAEGMDWAKLDEMANLFASLSGSLRLVIQKKDMSEAGGLAAMAVKFAKDLKEAVGDQFPAENPPALEDVTIPAGPGVEGEV